jgi:D-alanine-D-alanine ligase
MMKKKLRIGVLFGGRSAEHEVSLVSATAIIEGLRSPKYLSIPIGIAPDGRWIVGDGALKLLKEKTLLSSQAEHILLPDPRIQALVKLSGERLDASADVPVDVIFPIIHGTDGEDGALQGLLEVADIPYVGAGVLGSALGMDKVVAKELFRQAGLPVSPSVWFYSDEFDDDASARIARLEKLLKYPMFVKPANAGSSIGITKAHNRAQLREAIPIAARYDRKILVERCVKDAREIELSVLGNSYPEASLPGEIVPSNEFYDYDAKYIDGASTSEIPAKLPKSVVSKLQAFACQAFSVLNCHGMARVDFLVSRKTNAIFVNELNTIPGFTPISMYPKLWEASGLPYPELLDRLIHLALERHATKRKLRTMYTPKTEWYR